jgi:Zn-dependent M28 family amino/carboxypeptidase
MPPVSLPACRGIAAALALLLALSSCSQTRRPDTPASSTAVERGAATITEASYRKHLAVISSDEFGGRAPASPGEELTVNYLADNFARLGLTPANGDSYIQHVPLVSIAVINQPELVISGGRGRDLDLAYGGDQVVFTRRQQDEIELTDSEIVFVGYGINAPERNWNDYAGVDVAGKTVVILVNDPGYATQDPGLFNGNAMTYYGRWDYKFDEAARQGAAAAIIVHDTKPAAYPWQTVENSWTGTKFYGVRADRGAGLAAVESWISRDSAEALFAKAGLALDNMYELARTPGFRPVPLPLSASTKLVNETKAVVSRNVAAILRGSEAPGELFIYTAHWDHFGTDPALPDDGIYNGAFDNATGTAGLLELATAFASLEQAPRRSVLFLALTAEEQGLLGSAHYAANPLYPLADTVAGLNMDGLNVIGPTRDVTVIGYGFSELDQVIHTAASEQGRVLAPDREAEKGSYFRSDHFELAKRGVPMIYPKYGYDHVERGIEYGMAASADYTANRYHRVTDQYSDDWIVAGAIQDLRLYFRVGQIIADGSLWPNWNEGSEFKALRDAQRADD